MPAISLVNLLARGDMVAVERGRLLITPFSGKPVPPEWLAQHGQHIIAQAARQTGIIALAYVGFSVGNYGKHLAGGVTLQFFELNTRQPFFAVFNADTKRKRTSRAGKAGTPLPTRQFSVGKRSAFAQFWMSTGLPYQRLSSLYRRMGRLEELTFVAEVVNGEKLMSATLKPLEISALVNSRGTIGELLVNNLQTTTVNTQPSQSQNSCGFQVNSGTGGNRYGNTVIRNTGNGSVVIPLSSTIKDSEHTDWFDDHARDPGLSGKVGGW